MLYKRLTQFFVAQKPLINDGIKMTDDSIRERRSLSKKIKNNNIHFSLKK